MITSQKHKPHSSLLFLKEGLKKFRTQGSLVPSSKYLGNRIAKRIPSKDGIIVAELGAGTGVFTRIILSRIPASGTLVVFEINHNLAEYLKKNIKDKRLIVIEGDAVKMKKHFDLLSLRNADCIVSGLPFGDFTHEKRQELLSAIADSLDEYGIYLQFQYLLASLGHIRSMFDTKVVGYEFRNFPPAFLYECKKKS